MQHHHCGHIKECPKFAQNLIIVQIVQISGICFRIIYQRKNIKTKQKEYGTIHKTNKSYYSTILGFTTYVIKLFYEI